MYENHGLLVCIHTNNTYQKTFLVCKYLVCIHTNNTYQKRFWYVSPLQ